MGLLGAEVGVVVEGTEGVCERSGLGFGELELVDEGGGLGDEWGEELGDVGGEVLSPGLCFCGGVVFELGEDVVPEGEFGEGFLDILLEDLEFKECGVVGGEGAGDAFVEVFWVGGGHAGDGCAQAGGGEGGDVGGGVSDEGWGLEGLEAGLDIKPGGLSGL